MKVLYICTHNRCRSILSEAITNQMAGDVIQARSAGSQPAGEVHPLSIQYLKQTGYATEGLQSQSWDEFEDFAPDVVITVCDSAAGEACPLYFGNSLKLHWGLNDPSKVEGSDKQKAEAFRDCIAEIERRVKVLTDLAGKDLSPAELGDALTQQGAQS
ncbi:Arsenate reductase (glutaredoxin) [Saliniradius amylolyticus]|uniref:Arsenate reductase (Glutaredoxin) n=1 Tax=Saliniradius amylolyticus TaxID=2183582 RepID=A0A2S2DZJ6_9ALTE|nr:arsenate reductase ArsC [Saliniradius amylolyticus]AWL10828.1 Arsenate reductase (glutaredoxin) [Saliniradius amylolyticus]